MTRATDMRSQEQRDLGFEIEWRRRVAANPKERARIRRAAYGR